MRRSQLHKLAKAFNRERRLSNSSSSGEEEPNHELNEVKLYHFVLRLDTTYSAIPERGNQPAPSTSGYLEPIATNQKPNMPENTPGHPPPDTPLHNTGTPNVPLHQAIRVIPTHTNIRQFAGSETDYTARQFLDLCESSIFNYSMTEGHDKIAFTRSRLLPGSRALNLMQSSAFPAGDIGVNYEIFKKNFIKIFFWGVTNLASLDK